MSERFAEYIGKIANICYREEQGIKSRKGHIVSADDEFLELRTYHNLYLIRISDIISLKLSLEGENERR